MTIIIPPVPLPPFGGQAYNHITPFTYRDGLTYIEVLESLRTYIRDVLVPLVDGGFDALEEYVNSAIASNVEWTEAQIAALTLYVNETIADQTASNDAKILELETYVNEQVSLIINDSIQVQDPVVAGIMSEPDSDTRIVTDDLYISQVELDAGIIEHSGESLAKVSVLDYGAIADSNGTPGNGTDNAAAFLAAIEHANSINATVVIPGGKWRSSVSLDITYAIEGAGNPGYGNDPASPLTMIVFDADIYGVKLAGRGSKISNIYLRGGNSGVDAHGIVAGHIGTIVRDVTVHGFGGDGYFADSTPSTFPEIINTDHAIVDGLMSRSNAGDGIHLQGGPDVNAMRLVNLNLVGNGGWGAWVDRANRNWIQGHIAANVTGGVWDNGNSNEYDVYIEADGAGGTFVLGAQSIYGSLRTPNYARVTPNVTLAPTAWQTWDFREQNGGRRSLYLYDNTEGPVPVTGKTWRAVSLNTIGYQVTNVTDAREMLRLANDGTVSMIGGTTFRPLTIGAQDIGAPATKWRNAFFAGTVGPGSFTTVTRPTATVNNIGAMIWDSTLGKPVWSNGTGWVDATGTAV